MNKKYVIDNDKVYAVDEEYKICNNTKDINSLLKEQSLIDKLTKKRDKLSIINELNKLKRKNLILSNIIINIALLFMLKGICIIIPFVSVPVSITCILVNIAGILYTNYLTLKFYVSSFDTEKLLSELNKVINKKQKILDKYMMKKNEEVKVRDSIDIKQEYGNIMRSIKTKVNEPKRLVKRK